MWKLFMGRISKAFVYSRNIPKYEGICILNSKNVKLMFDIARDSYNKPSSSSNIDKFPIYASHVFPNLPYTLAHKRYYEYVCSAYKCYMLPITLNIILHCPFANNDFKVLIDRPNHY